MKRYKKVRIFLTGGLGNQLFQLAAAMHYAKSRVIEIDLVNSNPRRNSKGDAELLSLDLPNSIKLIQKKQKILITKIVGYNLRTGYLPNKFEKKSFFKILRNFLSSLALSFLLRKPFQVRVATNLGHDSKIRSQRRNEILIGYFQTEMTAMEIGDTSNFLFNCVGESLYQDYLKLSQKEHPLLVHVRLGDYVSEERFGVLTHGYYKKSIDLMWKSGKYKKIWLFSDEPMEALSRIPENMRDKTRIIHSENLESAETLRIMTICKGYIIANSTFSWWAAYLRGDKTSVVIAPVPWFVDLPEPLNLIPQDWKRLKGF